MHVWSRVAVRTGGATSRLLYRFVMICASGLVLYGWLTYANNSIAWLPYENWLLQPEGVSLRR